MQFIKLMFNSVLPCTSTKRQLVRTEEYSINTEWSNTCSKTFMAFSASVLDIIHCMQHKT